MNNTEIDYGKRLEGKRVAVIGGATGIGFTVAEIARAQGAAIVVGSTTESSISDAVGRLQGATGKTVDLRDESSVAAFFEALGAFDHLVITAGDWGGPMYVSSRDIDVNQARGLLDVRFWGSLTAAKHGSRKIVPGGSMTFTSGTLAQRPIKGAPMMTAVGGAIEHLVRGLAMDLAPVRVNAVSPGITLTDQTKKMGEATLQSFLSLQPIPRGASPAETAQAYVYLMLNGYVTGQILPVDGGSLLV